MGNSFTFTKNDKIYYSNYTNPCVIKDKLNGAVMIRLYYNTYDVPYIYYNGELILASGRS
jgi:hypothetical protein